MQAMVLRHVGDALVSEERDRPVPPAGHVRVKVGACAICRTDLHLLDGELEIASLPVVPGHQIVGVVDEVGAGVELALGQRVGIPWLGSTCGVCAYCRSGRENLCGSARFTGCNMDGGFAEYAMADARFCFPLSLPLSDAEVAPFLCAGLIGYRSLKVAGDAERIGLFGFGAAAHLTIQIARHRGQRVVAFTRPGDEAARRFALELGAEEAMGSDEVRASELDAAIIYAPVGALVPVALRSVVRGGTVVCGGIHMTEIPAFPYELLWGERSIRSVANLTRADGTEFFRIAGEARLTSRVVEYPLAEVNAALADLRHGRKTGSLVVVFPRSAG